MDLDVLLAHDDSRQALARLVALSVPLGRLVLQYLRLFKPGTRAMSHGRTVKLVEELLPDLERGAVTHRGREWRAPIDVWQAAIEQMLAQRDKLVLPMKSHGYLVEIVVGLADKAEAAQERDREADRRARRSTVEVAAAETPLAAAPAAPQGPSRYAAMVRAEIEAKRQRREGDDAIAG